MKVWRPIFFWGVAAQSGPRPPRFEVLNETQLDTHVHPAGFLWTSDQLVAEAHSTQQTQEANIYALSGIRTHDPSNQAAAYALFCPAAGIGIIRLYCFDIPSSLEFCYKLRHTNSGAISGSDRRVYASEIRSAPLATHEHNIILFFAASGFLVGESWYYGLLIYNPV
jgi:hypothetical protein